MMAKGSGASASTYEERHLSVAPEVQSADQDLTAVVLLS